MFSKQIIGQTESFPLHPSFPDGRKLAELDQIRLWTTLSSEPSRPSRQILEALEAEGFPLAVTVRHINRFRAKWGFSRGKGRPRGKQAVQMSAPVPAVVKMLPHVSFIGVHLFAAWMESQEGFAEIVALLLQRIEWYAEMHPKKDFPLLHHKPETLLHRFQALFYAPLLGIGKLTEFDVKEHPLESLIGRGYQSSTLNQFLGQLERIEAGIALAEALIPAAAGSIGYVDGHMIGYWTRKSMHKGKITMLGRIMAGSQAIITHNEDGRALCVKYYPPDTRMPHFIVEYCSRIMAVTGIVVYVIDREINSVALAREFEAAGVGVLSMLDSNEYDGLSSWTATQIGILEDGNIVYEGQWAEPREDDPRHFVLVQTPDRVLPFWGTSKVKEVLDPLAWPEAYRQRTDTQERRFKEMKAHGALGVNYGTKTIAGPDRHQQRACEKLTRTRDNAVRKLSKKDHLLEEQKAKVAESLEKGHTTRLEQRQRKLSQLEQEALKAKAREEQLSGKLKAVEAPRQRQDRDFRKQTIMTLRTLMLENALMAFLFALCGNLQEHVSLETLLKLLFERSGVYMETSSEMIYLVNIAGLSAAYRSTLANLITGLNKMNLTCRGKPIRIRIRDGTA